MLASLDPVETSCQHSTCGTAHADRIHHRSRAARNAVLSALRADPLDSFAKRVSRIDACGRFPVVQLTTTGDPRLCLSRCRDRLCPFCCFHRSLVLGRKFERVVRACDAPRMITLTLRGGEEPLAAVADRLADCFRKLRQTVQWKARVKGGLWVIEITTGRSGDHWHVHLHVVADGSFFPQAELADLWESITGDSRIVDIRAVSSRSSAARYVAKYVGKSGSFADWQPEQIREAASALHRRRLYGTFGTLHSAGKALAEDDDDRPRVARSIQAAELEDLASSQDPDAETVVRIARQWGGWWSIVFASPGTVPTWTPPVQPTPAQLHAFVRSLCALTLDQTSPQPPPTSPEATEAVRTSPLPSSSTYDQWLFEQSTAPRSALTAGL